MSPSLLKSRRPIFTLLKSRPGLSPVQETVNRDGKTFQETFYVKNGEETSGDKPASAAATATPQGGPPQLPPDLPIDSNSLKNFMLSKGFVEADPKLPADTRDVHMVDGQWSPERSELHAKIAASFLNKAKPVPANQKPVAMVMMGGPGSGKSSANKNFNLDDFVPADPDAIKEQIPEYQEGLKSKALNSAAMVHEESSYLNNLIRESAVAQRKNLLLDGVGADYDKMAKRINDLKSQGYHVRLVSVHLPPEEGMKRAAARAAATGRWVPLDEVVRPAYDKIPGNFQRLADLSHDAVAFDNNVPPGSVPALMYTKTHNGATEVQDPQRYAQYMGEPAANS